MTSETNFNKYTNDNTLIRQGKIYMIRMSKILYVGALALAFISLFLFGLPALYLLNDYSIPRDLGIDDNSINLLVALMGFLSVVPFILIQTLVTLTVIYKMWASIADGLNTRMSPGKAIGFLFIPFYNLYWIIQVWNGFPEDYNRYIDDFSLSIPKISNIPYLVYAITVLLCIIPFLGILLALIAPIILMFVTAKTCDAVNNLADAKV